jgi:hypothetical protein
MDLSLMPEFDGIGSLYPHSGFEMNDLGLIRAVRHRYLGEARINPGGPMETS